MSLPYHIKYRPKKIEELDNVEVREKIKAYLTSKERPQAFLFSGPKGGGKTSAARIVAKAANCLNFEKTGDVCQKCDNCIEIDKGKSMDIIEIDAASNRGIDDVKSIKDKALLTPINLKTKVFIIDEAHMMTREAFNAMLKLIEEPPEHTMFILCTTDPQKVPDTVRSRLVKVDFKRGSREEIEGSIKRIVVGEGLELSDKVISEIFDLSEGSFRNAARILLEMSLEAGKKIDEEWLKTWSERGGEYQMEKLEEDLAARQTQVIIDNLELMLSFGYDCWWQKLSTTFLDPPTKVLL